MLTFSKKEEQSIQFITYLARQKESVSLSVIAREIGITLPFLRQIAFDLRRAGIVTAHEGKNGGYSLAKLPKDISVAMIIEAIEKKPLLTCCSPLDREGHVCQCSKEVLWKKLQRYHLKNMYRITFDKLTQ